VRVIVLGGTRFIGRASVERLAASGHEVLVVHRGQWEPTDSAEAQHLHVDRAELASARAALRDFHADAVMDSVALTRSHAETALAALPEGLRLVVLSSVDVYRAYSSLMAGTESDPVPLSEDSPVRDQRYPYRGQGRADMDDYEKLDVEETYLTRGATILRLPMVHGEHDRQRREEFILRRVRAGRRQIPFGAGMWLTCRCYVGYAAHAIQLALERTDLAGQVFNIAETSAASMRLWAQQILQVANHEAELVRVPDDVLPEDLRYTGTVSQHLQADASKARALLGWQPGDPLEGLRRSVDWHLANPPTEPDPGFEADDSALQAKLSTATE
jgi:nucleoside-diphosphate-sugar epimerase